MVAWLCKWTCPGWIHLPRKPHPFGNELGISLSRLFLPTLFYVELVEGKDHPPQRPAPEFEETMGKTGGLILRMTKPVWGSKRIGAMRGRQQQSATRQLLPRGSVLGGDMGSSTIYCPNGRF